MANFVIGIPSVTKTVKIRRPGRGEEQLTADIRVHSVAEQDELEKKRKTQKYSDHIQQVKSDTISLGGIEDAEGNPVTSSNELLDAVFDDPYALQGLIRAWGEVQMGVQEAEAKN